MKVKIIKPYQLRETKTWPIGQLADVTNDFGKHLISEGYAHEIRFETRHDHKGIPFEVQVEVIDKSSQIVSEVKEKKSKSKDTE